MAGMVAQCSGWLSSSVSFGRTSMPQVSVQMVAISFSAIQAQVANARPGAGPPAYVPHSPRARRSSIWPVRTMQKSPRCTSTPCACAVASRSATVIA